MALKDDVFRFRISAAEKRLIEQAAEREKLNPSTWVRMLALKAAEASAQTKGKKARS